MRFIMFKVFLDDPNLGNLEKKYLIKEQKWMKAKKEPKV